MTDQLDLSGRSIGGFVVRERLDEGGFGAVYACEQPLLGREAVIKVLHSRLLRSDDSVQRFQREAKLASRLDHRYAAHIYAFGIEPDGLLWLAMERVPGVTLARWLSTHGPMPLGRFVPFFQRIAEVVQTAHECGIVHRDLKPSNIMVIERAGELSPKLLDFGVAKLLDGAMPPESMADINYPPLLHVNDLLSFNDPPLPDDPPGKTPKLHISTATETPAPGRAMLTSKDQTLGSPPYMSPEQWCDPGTVGPTSDLYALGVVVFEALTGHRPFQGATLTELAELHCRGEVPSLGGNFPPALDHLLQRALAKRPEDRWGTALELAGALRSASGLGADLPRIDDSVRDAWLGEAPQPLAESVAALDGAHNAHQARDAAQELVRTLLRYLLALALATRPRDDQDDLSLLDLVRALRKRELSAEDRLQLLRLLVRPHGDHPVAALVDLVTPGPDGTDALAPILGLYSITDHSGSEDSVRLRMGQRIPVLSQLLHKTTFLLDYVLVVPRGGAAERWTGLRRRRRGIAAVRDGELVEGHPMLLDRNGRICADLWPLVQAAPPSDGADPELFVFDGRGRDGAQLIAAPRSIVRNDASAWAWVETHLIAEVEAKARMRDQISTAARQWHDRGRADGLLWRGDVLADFERWTRHTAAPPFGDPEAAFIAASRRAERRRRWGWRALIAAGVMIALVAVEYREVQQARMAEHDITQAEVEQGRQALLHDEMAEALLHLSEAYRRGDHSPGVVFMLARALQPRRAELARLPASTGRMWSSAFSPDGRQIVTTDDASARLWDARTNQLLRTLPHGDTVYDARYMAGGARLITACGDGAVRIWDTATGKLERVLRGGKAERYAAVAVSPDGGVVTAMDTTGTIARAWNAATGAELAELANDASGFPSIAFSADGRWLATSGGNDVRAFDAGSWTRALTIAGPRIRSLSFAPTGSLLATGSGAGDVSIWDVPSGARVHHLRELGQPVDAVAFSPDGRLVAAAARDGIEQIWQAGSGELQSQIAAVRGKILSIEFDPTSMLLAAASDAGTVVVTDIAQGMSVVELEGPRGIVRVAHFAPGSHRIIGASWDGTARVWDARSPYRSWASPPIADDCGLTSSLEPDRRFIAVGCGDRNTQVWDTANDRLLAELPSVTPAPGDFASAFAAVSAAGDLAAIARGNTVEIYELPGGRLLRTITHDAPVNAVAFAPSGHNLVTGTVNGSLQVTSDGRDPAALPRASGGIDSAAILTDGRVVAADADRHLRVYAPGGVMLTNLELSSRVRMLRPSQDGHSLVTIPSLSGPASAAPTLFDLDRYRQVATLDGHAGRVLGARFVEGARIITAGNDGAARLWDGSTGQLIQVYRGRSRFLADVTIDGPMVVAGGSDGLLWFWDLATGRALWTLQAHKSHVVGIHLEGRDLVTRGFSGEVSRWTLPDPDQVISACAGDDCDIVPR